VIKGYRSIYIYNICDTYYVYISLYDLLINLRDVGRKEEKVASWVARRGLRSVRIGSLKLRAPSSWLPQDEGLNPHLLDQSKGHKGI
jgi:hypothetical protein